MNPVFNIHEVKIILSKLVHDHQIIPSIVYKHLCVFRQSKGTQPIFKGSNFNTKLIYLGFTHFHRRVNRQIGASILKVKNMLDWLLDFSTCTSLEEDNMAYTTLTNQVLVQNMNYRLLINVPLFLRMFTGWTNTTCVDSMVKALHSLDKKIKL